MLQLRALEAMAAAAAFANVAKKFTSASGPAGGQSKGESNMPGAAFASIIEVRTIAPCAATCLVMSSPPLQSPAVAVWSIADIALHR